MSAEYQGRTAADRPGGTVHRERPAGEEFTVFYRSIATTSPDETPPPSLVEWPVIFRPAPHISTTIHTDVNDYRKEKFVVES